MAEHVRFFALLEVERNDQRVAAVLRESGDIYVRDTARLVGEAQAAGLVPDEDDPTLLAIGVLGAVSQFCHYHRTRPNGRRPIEELAKSRRPMDLAGARRRTQPARRLTAERGLPWGAGGTSLSRGGRGLRSSRTCRRRMCWTARDLLVAGGTRYPVSRGGCDGGRRPVNGPRFVLPGSEAESVDHHPTRQGPRAAPAPGRARPLA